MKKLFLTFAVLVMAICASAQKNQYFWYQGNLMMGNPIAQIDSVTFGTEDTDSILVYLPRTIIKTIHDTVYITIHDTVCPNDVPEGALNGVFSVSADKKVLFSKGNVQYDATNHVWRFAEHQFDYTANTSYFDPEGASGWIDLFGFGTGDNPLNCNNDPSSYSDFVDLGVNFSNEEKGIIWRTLSDAEWTYLLTLRENHETLLAKAQVSGKNGIIIFPDNYQDRNNISIQYGSTNPYTANVISDSQWSELEGIGVVFLPAAGWADNDYYQSPGVYDIHIYGNYWSSTSSSTSTSYQIYFNNENVYNHYSSGTEKSDKRCVRLVIDVE